MHQNGEILLPGPPDDDTPWRSIGDSEPPETTATTTARAVLLLRQERHLYVVVEIEGQRRRLAHDLRRDL